MEQQSQWGFVKNPFVNLSRTEALWWDAGSRDERGHVGGGLHQGDDDGQGKAGAERTDGSGRVRTEGSEPPE